MLTKWKHPVKDYKKTYHVWHTMVYRCKATKGEFYKYYSSKGIKVCERWLDFDNFIDDMGEQPKGMTLERIDNNKGYEPENVKWATHKEQANNIRTNRHITIDGVTRTIAQWLDLAKPPQMHPQTLRGYLDYQGEEAFINRVRDLLEKEYTRKGK